MSELEGTLVPSIFLLNITLTARACFSIRICSYQCVEKSFKITIQINSANITWYKQYLYLPLALFKQCSLNYSDMITPTISIKCLLLLAVKHVVFQGTQSHQTIWTNISVNVNLMINSGNVDLQLSSTRICSIKAAVLGLYFFCGNDEDQCILLNFNPLMSYSATTSSPGWHCFTQYPGNVIDGFWLFRLAVLCRWDYAVSIIHTCPNLNEGVRFVPVP